MSELIIQIFAAFFILTLGVHVPFFLWIQFQKGKSGHREDPKKNPKGETSYFDVLKASTNVLDAYADFTEATEGLLKKLQQTPPGTKDREFLVGVLNKLITTYSMIEKDKSRIIAQLKEVNGEADISYETNTANNSSGRQIPLSQPCS